MMKNDLKTKFFSYSDEDQDLWLLLTRTRYAIFRAREKELQKYGISPEQVGALLVVQAFGNKATLAEISRVILRQPHSVAALVERMTKKGFVKKVKAIDRRTFSITITEKGQKVYELSSKRGTIHHIMSALTEEEKRNLRAYLEKLSDAA